MNAARKQHSRSRAAKLSIGQDVRATVKMRWTCGTRPPSGAEPQEQRFHDAPVHGAHAVKALTIRQPYAELICRKDKLVENRAWRTPYRGALAIHAAKNRTWLDHDDLTEYPDMAFGAIVAIARLVDCVRRAELSPALIGHAHAEGPWCWLLEDVRRLPAPIPCAGTYRLWALPDATRYAILGMVAQQP